MNLPSPSLYQHQNPSSTPSIQVSTPINIIPEVAVSSYGKTNHHRRSEYRIIDEFIYSRISWSQTKSIVTVIDDVWLESQDKEIVTEEWYIINCITSPDDLIMMTSDETIDDKRIILKSAAAAESSTKSTEATGSKSVECEIDDFRFDLDLSLFVSSRDLYQPDLITFIADALTQVHVSTATTMTPKSNVQQRPKLTPQSRSRGQSHRGGVRMKLSFIIEEPIHLIQRSATPPLSYETTSTPLINHRRQLIDERMSHKARTWPRKKKNHQDDCHYENDLLIITPFSPSSHRSSASHRSTVVSPFSPSRFRSKSFESDHQHSGHAHMHDLEHDLEVTELESHPIILMKPYRSKLIPRSNPLMRLLTCAACCTKDDDYSY